jgi:hypothetical protein
MILVVSHWHRNRPREFDAQRPAAWLMPTTVRLAAGVDLAALQRLAELDSRRLPPGPHLLAERDGRIEAALSLSSHEVIADPFRHTAELRELLHCHAGSLRTARPRSTLPLLQPHPLPVET